MQKCEYSSICQLVGSPTLVKLYTEKYCSGFLMDNCTRRNLYGNGDDVPVTLLPNGHHFERRNRDRRKLIETGTLQNFFSDRRFTKRRATD